jgi:cytochrome c553
MHENQTSTTRPPRLGVHRRTIESSILFVAFTTWACTTLAAADADAPMPSAMDQRVRACTSCHGVQGQGRDNDYFPRIAGKPADYLFNQLIAFRDGGRTYPPMGYLIAFLPDDYLHKISEYFANLQPPYPNADTGNISPAVLQYGERLVTHGDPARKLPACAACHGARLTGAQPGIPGLLGLHASYIAGQMGTWRSGTRHAVAPDCMHAIAVKLTDKDITAVSSWLARQPRPDDPRPASSSDGTLPLACGSQPQ